MMKKLLVLVLVFGTASIADAKLGISVNGEMNITELTLSTSDYIPLAIWTDSAIRDGVGEGYYALVADTSRASIDYTTGFPLISDSGVFINNATGANALWGGLLPANENGVAGEIFLTTVSSIAANSTIFDMFDYYSTGFGDVTLKLYYRPDGTNMTLSDTVLIHQTPEPASALIMTLGSLFIGLRRKRS
jgi:hypothetical protein